MRFFNRLTAVWMAAALLAPLAPLEARTRKGDKYLAEGRIAEGKKDWDTALADFEKALSEDPGELTYQMATQKARFQCTQMHVDNGMRLRTQGQLDESMMEFRKAYAISPGSAVSAQEVEITRQMIERERKRQAETGRETPAAERALTPVQEFHKQEKESLGRLLGVPELKPLNPAPINLKMNNKAKVLFDTVAKYAGLNLLWDPEYQNPQHDGFNVELNDSTVEQALDYVALITKSYWKAVSANTIFVTNDQPKNRQSYEDHVVKVFYLQNIQSDTELNEVVTILRTVADIQKVVAYKGQNAIVARGEADKIELAGQIVADLDKPKAEVVVDLMVIEASTTFSRQITAAIASTGLNVPVTFNPRSSIQAASTTSSSSTSTTSTSTTAASTLSVPLDQLSHIGKSDFATTLPSALLQAVLSDSGTRILQAPQLRSVDNVKATLKIGEKEPIATGSFQSTATTMVSPLVNTQFTYQDVGVNVELTPRVHENGDVTMHIDLDISTVASWVDMGSGVKQPVIGQRKVQHDIRMREGEIGLLGGLINTEDDKSVTGIPGLSSIPLLGNLFKGSSVNHNRDELMIVVIPHVIRQPEITAQNLRTIAVGSNAIIHLNHSARPQEAAPEPAATPAATATQAAPGAGVTMPIAPLPALAPPATAPAANNPLPNPPVPGLPPATAPALTPGSEPPPTGAARAISANPAAHLSFQPGRVEAAAGANFTVAVALDNAQDVASAPMTIEFDPRLLRLNDIAPGSLLAVGGQPPAFTRNVENERGVANVTLNVAAGSPGVTAATGTLVTLSFQAIGAGTGAVRIPSMAAKNSRGGAVAGSSAQLIVSVK
jgi:general secretion pathway protein D